MINKARLDIRTNLAVRTLVQHVSKEISMPVCFAGGINSISDADFLFKNGIDKISINTAALAKPRFITEIAKKYGSQSVCACIDYKYTDSKAIEVFSNSGVEARNIDIFKWVDTCLQAGVGEIILNCISLDGLMKGVDLELPAKLRKFVNVPLILSGGCASWVDFESALNSLDMDGVAASTFFSDTDQNIVELKRKLTHSGTLVRVD